MRLKVCSECGEEKPVSDFPKRNETKDGYRRQCKPCHRAIYKRQKEKRMEDPEYAESFTEAQVIYKKRYHNKYPEKKRAKTRGLNVYKKGLNQHHWSYKEGDEKDVIWMKPLEHTFLHTKLIYDKDLLIYRTIDGELLDTKEKHESYFLKIIETHNPCGNV